MSRCPSVHQSHDPAVQSCSSKQCACKVHCTVCLLPAKDSVQHPPAPTRTGASSPLSDALIKVGLLPSCLHNNTLDSSSAADAARGSHYLARRHSLWLANGPGTAPVQVSLKEKGWAKTGHLPSLLNSKKCLTLCTHLIRSLFLSQFAYASFPPGAECPESQPAPVDWTDLNCHCTFVVGCIKGTGSLGGNLGQRKPAQRCQPRKTEWQERGCGDNMG